MQRFLIGGGHPLALKGLEQLLGELFNGAVIVTAQTGPRFFNLLGTESWNLILIDLSLPSTNTIDLLKRVRSKGIEAPILLMGTQTEETYALRSLKAGACGFVPKESSTTVLSGAIQQVLRGRKYISPALAEKLVESPDSHNIKLLHHNLSDREFYVFQLIASGKMVSEIAKQMSLSVNTISTYRTRIIKKLGAKNNSELIRYALSHNLV